MAAIPLPGVMADPLVAQALAWIDRHHRALMAALLAAYAALGLAFVRWGPLWPDEHFYVSASAAVASGRTPIVDFFYPQSPLTPYAYGLPARVVGTSLVAMRLVSFLAGLGALLLAMQAARRAGARWGGSDAAGRLAAFLAGATVLASLQTVYYFSTVSSLSLAALLLAAVALLLVSELPRPARVVGSALLLALATGVRLNSAVAFLPFGLYVWAVEGFAWALVAALVGGAATALLYAPFLLHDPAEAWFNLVRYHTLDGRDPGQSLVQRLKFKADGAHYLLDQFPFVMASAALGALLVALRLRGRAAWRAHAFPVFLAAVCALVVAANFTKVYFQFYYLMVALPALAILVGVLYARLLPRAGVALAALVAILLVANAASWAPTLVRHNAPMESPAVVAEVGAFVRARTQQGDTVLASETAFVVASGRAPTPGTEMSIWSYYPAMPGEEAARHRVLNASMLTALVANATPAALVLATGDFTTTPFPTAELKGEARAAAERAFLDAVAARYAPARTWGEGPGSVTVWLRR